MDRDIVLGLLDKMGASYMDEITLERAVKKLQRYLNRHGIPEDLTDDEAWLLASMGVIVMEGETHHREEKEPTPTKTGPRMHWMKAATLAIMQNPVIEEAEKAAVDIYLEGGGNKAKNIVTNAQLYVSRAIVALETAGTIKITEDKKRIEFLV